MSGNFAVESVATFSVEWVATLPWNTHHCQKNGAWSAYEPRIRADYDHDRFGTWPQDLHFEFGAFQSSFDSEDDDTGDGNPDFLAVPHWVAYEIRRYGTPPYKLPKPSPMRPRPWYEIPALKFLSTRESITQFRIDKSYSGFGVAPGSPALGNKIVHRGHFAMKVHAQRLGWREACNTHVFINAAPQQKELNLGIWLDLEAYSGAAANKYGRVWIVTGPIFDSKKIKFLQNKNTIPIAIPTRFFKIIIKENPENKVPDVLAFWFKQPDSGYVVCGSMKKKDKLFNYEPHFTSIADIEDATDLQFLRNVYFKNNKERQAFKKIQTQALWPIEGKYFDVNCTR